MCVVRLCLQYQGRGGPLQIGTGGHIRGAVGGRFGWGSLSWRPFADWHGGPSASVTPGLGECGRTYDQRPTGSCGRR